MKTSRSLPPTPAFWLTMLIGSAFGTNLGDFVDGGLGLGRPGSFAALSALCVWSIWRDRVSQRSETWYWIAIVALRAAATNLGDFVTHDLRIGYEAASIAAAVLTLIAGSWTRPGSAGTPLIDGRYWGAMLIAGFFGTVAGDLAAHLIGRGVAAGVLTLALVALLWMRSVAFPTAIIGYWCVVLLERCAGTPIGDALASRRSLGLGDTIATLCTGTLFAAALLLRHYTSRAKHTAPA
jgi:uncharacterized membrane-anchored protein